MEAHVTDTPAPKIAFPCDDYPIKVVVRAGPDVRSRVDAVFMRHFGEVPAVNERSSARRNFVSFTYVMRVESVEQLGALHAELRTHADVMMVL